MKWRAAKKKKRESGWLIASLRPQELAIVHGRIGPNGKARIGRLASRALEGDFAGADRLSREWHLERYRCATLLEPGDYQLLLVEAPNVPPAELKAAIRWRIKDLLDYHVDDATVDVLDIPPDPSGAAGGHSMYAVAARNDAIQACIERFDAAQIPLSVIDVAETAQRNVAALYEDEGRGVGMLYLGDSSGLFTINYRRELYLARRIDIGYDQVSAAPERDRGVQPHRARADPHAGPFRPPVRFRRGQQAAARPRAGGQRTARVPAGPTSTFRSPASISPRPSRSMSDARPDRRAEWQRFHLIGASLRHGLKAP